VDILGWLWWAAASVLGVVWGFVWFLLGGWVSALAQIAVVVLLIFAMKYGWRQAPYEVWSRVRSFSRFAWNWIRAREPGQQVERVRVREVIRTVRVKEPGDVNLSTILNVLLLVGLCLVGTL
jgi:hypothetical protein